MTNTASKSVRRFARPPVEESGLKPEPVAEPKTGTAAQINTDAVATAPRSESKIALVAGMLERSEGASLAELVAATGWQPHTTRAALTGLKKKGHVIGKAKVEDVTRYSICKAEAA